MQQLWVLVLGLVSAIHDASAETTQLKDLVDDAVVKWKANSPGGGIVIENSKKGQVPVLEVRSTRDSATTKGDVTMSDAQPVMEITGKHSTLKDIHDEKSTLRVTAMSAGNPSIFLGADHYYQEIGWAWIYMNGNSAKAPRGEMWLRKTADGNKHKQWFYRYTDVEVEVNGVMQTELKMLRFCPHELRMERDNEKWDFIDFAGTMHAGIRGGVQTGYKASTETKTYKDVVFPDCEPCDLETVDYTPFLEAPYSANWVGRKCPNLKGQLRRLNGEEAGDDLVEAQEVADSAGRSEDVAAAPADTAAVAFTV